MGFFFSASYFSPSDPDDQSKGNHSGSIMLISQESRCHPEVSCLLWVTGVCRTFSFLRRLTPQRLDQQTSPHLHLLAVISVVPPLHRLKYDLRSCTLPPSDNKKALVFLVLSSVCHARPASWQLVSTATQSPTSTPAPEACG